MPGVFFDRPLLLFATPRSGSGAIYRLIAEALRRTKGWKPLGEFFEVTHHRFEDTGQEIRMNTYPPIGEPLPLSLNDSDSRACATRLRKERASILRRYPGTYTLKTFPSQLESEALFWLLQEFDWLFLERKDLFAQVLSFLMAYATRSAPAPDQSGVVASRSAFDQIQADILAYRGVKKLAAPRNVVEYEAICAMEPGEFLAGLGLEDAFPHISTIRTIDPSSQLRRLRCFANADEVLRWYHDSSLGQLSPLPKGISGRVGRCRKLPAPLPMPESGLLVEFPWVLYPAGTRYVHKDFQDLAAQHEKLLRRHADLESLHIDLRLKYLGRLQLNAPEPFQPEKTR